MALFFDQKWFGERLAAAGLTKADLAQSLGLTAAELEAMWKDQREIHEREIGTMALLLGVPESEVRKHGGIQGSAEARTALRTRRELPAPVAAVRAPFATDLEARVADLEARVAALEAKAKS